MKARAASLERQAQESAKEMEVLKRELQLATRAQSPRSQISAPVCFQIFVFPTFEHFLSHHIQRRYNLKCCKPCSSWPHINWKEARGYHLVLTATQISTTPISITCTFESVSKISVLVILAQYTTFLLYKLHNLRRGTSHCTVILSFTFSCNFHLWADLTRSASLWTHNMVPHSPLLQSHSVDIDTVSKVPPALNKSGFRVAVQTGRTFRNVDFVALSVFL